jgi:hypothetical protein
MESEELPIEKIREDCPSAAASLEIANSIILKLEEFLDGGRNGRNVGGVRASTGTDRAARDPITGPFEFDSSKRVLRRADRHCGPEGSG